VPRRRIYDIGTKILSRTLGKNTYLPNHLHEQMVSTFNSRSTPSILSNIAFWTSPWKICIRATILV
jgi:hypothetical protein